MEKSRTKPGSLKTHTSIHNRRFFFPYSLQEQSVGALFYSLPALSSQRTYNVLFFSPQRLQNSHVSLSQRCLYTHPYRSSLEFTVNSKLLQPSAGSLSNGVHSLPWILSSGHVSLSASSLALCQSPNLFTLTSHGGLPRGYHTGSDPRHVPWGDMAVLFMLICKMWKLLSWPDASENWSQGPWRGLVLSHTLVVLPAAKW